MKRIILPKQSLIGEAAFAVEPIAIGNSMVWSITDMKLRKILTL